MRDENKTKKQLIYELSEYHKQHEQVQEQLSFSSALNLIAETIIGNDDTHKILQTMVEIVGSTIRVDRALIYDMNFDKHLVIGLCEWLRCGWTGEVL